MFSLLLKELNFLILIHITTRSVTQVFVRVQFPFTEHLIAFTPDYLSPALNVIQKDEQQNLRKKFKTLFRV